MTYTDFSFTMTEVGNRLGPGSDQSNFDYGDNLDFKVAINFPVVPPADKFDLNLEVFTLEQSQGKRYVNIIQLADIKISSFYISNLWIYEVTKISGIGGFTLCSTHQESKGAGLSANPAVPEVSETPHETYSNIVSLRKKKSCKI